MAQPISTFTLTNPLGTMTVTVATIGRVQVCEGTSCTTDRKESGVSPAGSVVPPILAHCGGGRESWLGFLPVVKFFLPHMPELGLDLLPPSAMVLPPSGLTPTRAWAAHDL